MKAGVRELDASLVYLHLSISVSQDVWLYVRSVWFYAYLKHVF